ncbi:hypothetical protein [Synoicihabitans lomoniglobus]|uniref:Uncharacterized protein n=1 Tax=Synoicihabitans lomoniglobus TaxID=2909285 RepID=A0AAF0I4K0_9BACT|nr:hypothetical protein [Opitutaceae bacterium LMO-M01]WED66839.1 hypothetical protein PXH66_08250 [Opitutaceae bacterium LMO-M01]
MKTNSDQSSWRSVACPDFSSEHLARAFFERYPVKAKTITAIEVRPCAVTGQFDLIATCANCVKFTYLASGVHSFEEAADALASVVPLPPENE